MKRLASEASPERYREHDAYAGFAEGEVTSDREVGRTMGIQGGGTSPNNNAVELIRQKLAKKRTTLKDQLKITDQALELLNTDSRVNELAGMLATLGIS